MRGDKYNKIEKKFERDFIAFISNAIKLKKCWTDKMNVTKKKVLRRRDKYAK